MSALLDYLQTVPTLTKLCTQNGWIDNDTLRYEILEQDENQFLLSIEFEEVIVEGSGCVADHKSCYGRARVYKNDDGTYQAIEIL